MNLHPGLEAALTTSTPESRDEVYLWTLWSSVLVLVILAIVALVSDASLTVDQRVQVFQQSGVYP